MDELVGTTIAGRYHVRRKLGAGGMGAVYVAMQEPLGREVALKVILGELVRDPSAVERFKREATTMSQLQHANIVTIFDFGTSDGVLFLAMELLRGDTLRARINATGPFPPASTVSVVRDIASGLAVAHSAGVIHRDLKPDNIVLVESYGRGETAKILDFGVAKLAQTAQGATLTQAGMIVGTPGYIAPELAIDGVMNDPRSDLYALGVIWFEMLAGRPLFQAHTPMQLVMKHAMEAAIRPSSLINDIPLEMEELVMSLLGKTPAERPASAAALVDALDALSGGRASSAPVPRPKPGVLPTESLDMLGTAPTAVGLGATSGVRSSAKLARAPSSGGTAGLPSTESNPRLPRTPSRAPSTSAPSSSASSSSASSSSAPSSSSSVAPAEDATTSTEGSARRALIAAGVGAAVLVLVCVVAVVVVLAKKPSRDPVARPEPITAVKPVETKPVETKPVETKQVETKPVETSSSETKPDVVTKPDVETNHVVETKPDVVENKPDSKVKKPVVKKPVKPKPRVPELDD